MALSERFMVVAFNEHQETRQSFGTWPQHMSIVPWMCKFRLQATNRIWSAVSDLAPVQAVVNDTAQFGPKGNFKVWTLEKSAALLSLHQLVMEAAVKYGTELEDATFVGDTYAPHISRKRGQVQHSIGDELTFPEISIIANHEMLGKTVLHNILLQGRDEIAA